MASLLGGGEAAWSKDGSKEISKERHLCCSSLLTPIFAKRGNLAKILCLHLCYTTRSKDKWLAVKIYLCSIFAQIIFA